MLASSRTGLAAAVVSVIVAAAPASAAVAVPRPVPPRAAASVIPARVGMSLAYRYEFEQSGPRGTTTTHASVAFTRVSTDRVAVTVTPETGEPTAVAGRVATDGTLHLEAPSAGGRAGNASDATASDTDVPQNTPLGGLPDDSRGAGGGQAGSGAGRYGAAADTGAGTGGGRRAAQAPELSALASLLAFRATSGTTVPTWTFSTPVGPAGTGAVPLLALTAHATTASSGLVETIVADGHGDVQLAAAPSPSASSAPSASRGSGGSRRRGGGGGFPGGGGGFPGGGGGFPGGGGGEGGSRRGGQGAGRTQGEGAGGTSAARMVPATVALHVEAAFRDGRLQSARGTQTSTVHSGGTDATTTARWTLTAY